MDNRRIITHIRENVLMDALVDDRGRLLELTLLPGGGESLLGNVYVGRVKNVVKNIQAAFVEIENGTLCYLPLEDVKSPIYTKPKNGVRLAEGDELLVQVSREAVKTKAPSVTTNISLTGKYLVLTTGNHTVGYSLKLETDDRERLRAWVEQQELPDVGMIVRTNAAEAVGEELLVELERLKRTCAFLQEQAIHRGVRSCVLKNRPSYLNSILGSRSDALKEIVTDDRELYDEIRGFLEEEMPADLGKLRLYEEKSQSLSALYRLERGLQEALAERVWLKSGAYLIIQQTEALTVIDVNTGKYTGGRDKWETVRKINREAAAEIARQLRLRNLSGIILVDFVDMKESEDSVQLLDQMRQLLRTDPMKSTAVDMTKLGLMELTRKKEKKTLAEQAKECGL